MGAGASALQSLPDQVPKKQAQALAAATPGLHWDDHIWAEIEHSDGTADKVDIIGLLDQLNLRVRMAEENGEELLAVDGCAVSDDCPGAFSDQSDDDDGLPAMVFADGTGGLVVGASRKTSPARRKRAAKPRADVEETFASDGTAFGDIAADAPGTFDEDAEFFGWAADSKGGPDLALVGAKCCSP